MQIVFKIIFSVFALSAWGLVMLRHKEGLLRSGTVFLWSLVWFSVLAFVWYPNSTQVLADMLGIGRGVDLVIYSGLAFLFFVIFRLTVKIERLQRDITTVVRRNALAESEKN